MVARYMYTVKLMFIHVTNKACRSTETQAFAGHIHFNCPTFSVVNRDGDLPYHIAGPCISYVGYLHLSWLLFRLSFTCTHASVVRYCNIILVYKVEFLSYHSNILEWWHRVHIFRGLGVYILPISRLSRLTCRFIRQVFFWDLG